MGTEFCHRGSRRSPSLPVRMHSVKVIAPAPRARLILRLRPATRIAQAAPSAIDLPAVVERAEVANLRAARAANPDKSLDVFHAHRQGRPHGTCPARTLPAPSARQRPRATRRLRGTTLGLPPLQPTRSPTGPRQRSPLLGRQRDVPISPDLGDRQHEGSLPPRRTRNGATSMSLAGELQTKPGAPGRNDATSHNVRRSMRCLWR
jgi:hypothetical protein